MSSFRNHRVIIASLFLPSTAVFGESAPPTPDPPSHDADIDIQRLNANLAAAPKRQPAPALSAISAAHTRQNSASGLPPPLKSIVDDLKDKSRHPTPAIRSPTTETVNPFFKLTRFATLPNNDKPQIKLQTTRASEHSARIQRRQSRSSSRPNHKTHTAHPLSSSPSVDFPDNWHIEANPQCNGGLKNAVDSVGDRLKRKLWIGTLVSPGSDDFDEPFKKSIDDRMLSHRSSVPVWIPEKEFSSCYDAFCHQVLWPCLHYAVPDAPKTKTFYESASYQQYVAVNQRFADTIVKNYQEGDIIWVNDYHLMLLPAMLRAALPASAPIGFFMHVAFPSSEIFRCLSVRHDLLVGVLGADLVGFQTASYARHFRQTVSRILGWEALPKGIAVGDGDGVGYKNKTGNSLTDLRSNKDVKGFSDDGKQRVEQSRFVDVGVFAMGIDVKALKERKREPEVAEWVSVLKQRYAGMKILVGRDKLDEIQGVRQKILAFEAFLDKYPEFQEKVVLIQVALSTTEINELAGGAADVVSRLNSRFSTLTYQPVVFLHTQDLTFSQYLALLTVADAFLVTSLREGMALRTHEFVECQEGRHRPLVLSEFTGSYSYSGFRSCIAINPWDTRGTANAIHQALVMQDEEALSRWEDLHNHVTTQTAQTFVTTFLNRCVRAHMEHQIHDTANIVPKLDLASVLPRYKHSSGRRLILVDLEGTLWRRDLSREGLVKMLGLRSAGAGGLHHPENVEPAKQDARESQLIGTDPGETVAVEGTYNVPKAVIEVLAKLAEDRKNEVWVLSGLTTGVLDRVLGDVKKIGIVAENGCFIKPRLASRGGSAEWVNMVANFNLTWKSSCLEILNYFTERTPGSIIEERQASMVWRFWTGDANSDCQDRQWARRQAAEAQNHIFDSLGERYGLRIIPGKNSFLVLPNNVSRSTAVGSILHPGGPARSPQAGWMSPDIAGMTEDTMVAADVDFLLAVSGDEKLLRRLNESDGSETVSTSARGTDAKWKLDASEATRVLEMFAGIGA